MPLAIEPLHPMQAAERACINTLEQALDMCDALGEGIGVAVDVYHVWWDPKLESQIRRAGKKRILAYHICDWLVPTRDLFNDRGMMGDGVIDLPLHPRVGRGRGLRGLPGSGDLLRARLVEARPGRGAAHLQAAPRRIMTAGGDHESTRASEGSACRGGWRGGWLYDHPSTKATDPIPPEGIGRRIRHLCYSDCGGKPDTVQIMLNRGHLYVGHMFTDGITVLDASNPRNLKPVHMFITAAEHAHAPYAGGQRPDAARQRRQHRRHADL